MACLDNSLPLAAVALTKNLVRFIRVEWEILRATHASEESHAATVIQHLLKFVEKIFVVKNMSSAGRPHFHVVGTFSACALASITVLP
ncbi:MAG: hypothetical protein WDN28_12240 [Chthoniobacter sp.]